MKTPMGLPRAFGRLCIRQKDIDLHLIFKRHIGGFVARWRHHNTVQDKVK